MSERAKKKKPLKSEKNAKTEKASRTTPPTECRQVPLLIGTNGLTNTMKTRSVYIIIEPQTYVTS
jgi:hypothetical protein